MIYLAIMICAVIVCCALLCCSEQVDVIHRLERERDHLRAVAEMLNRELCEREKHEIKTLKVDANLYDECLKHIH